MFENSIDAKHQALHVPVLGRKAQAHELIELDELMCAQAQDEWVEDHQEIVLGRDTLDQSYFRANQDRFHALLRVARRNRVVPFVGAGVSASCGLPTWSAFLTSVARENGGKEAVAAVTKLIREGAFDEAASRVLELMGEVAFHETFERTFGRHASITSDGKLPRTLMAIFPGPVVTTNYDQLLEKFAMPEFDQKFLGRVPGEFARACREGERFLLKLHGDIFQNDTRVLTREEYRVAYGGAIALSSTTALIRTLRALFTRETVLFVGCSLGADVTMKLLLQLAAEDRDLKSIRHYAIVELPNNKKQRLERKKFLEERGVFPVWYPCGRHELVGQIIEELAFAVERSK